MFDELENIAIQLEHETGDTIRKELTLRRNAILNHHPGFSKDILAYNTITGKWFVYDTHPTPIPVTALAFKDKERFVIVSGKFLPESAHRRSGNFQLPMPSHPLWYPQL
ncbi:MAG: hypothetical protein R3C61_07185 [Bacteroidia bacterium]